MNDATFKKVHFIFLKSYNMANEGIEWTPKNPEYARLKRDLEKAIK